MSKKLLIPDEVVMNKIFLIREQKVMLDFDLAELYGVETKYLKRAVRRNKARFPKDFMFELNRKELQKLEVPIWHLKFAGGQCRSLGRPPLHADGFYRARCSDAFECAEQ